VAAPLALVVAAALVVQTATAAMAGSEAPQKTLSARLVLAWPVAVVVVERT
jgi:hypothetical protein